jgi:hypothetical protein
MLLLRVNIMHMYTTGEVIFQNNIIKDIMSRTGITVGTSGATQVVFKDSLFQHLSSPESKTTPQLDIITNPDATIVFDGLKFLNSTIGYQKMINFASEGIKAIEIRN